MTESDTTRPDAPDYANLPGPADASGGEALWPDLPRAKFEALMGKALVFLEASFRASDPKYGKDGTEFAVVRVTSPDAIVSGVDTEGAPVTIAAGDEFTTSTGGVRVVEQLRNTTEFPFASTPGREQTQGGRTIYTLLPVGAA